MNETEEMRNETRDDSYIPYHLRPETYIVPIIFILIFIVGLIGNGSLIYILCRHKTMRSVPNTFIFNLALGDLLVLLFSVPFTSTIYTLESWPFGELICKFTEFAKDMSVGVSVFTLTALSADRYTAIVKPVSTFVSGPKSKLMMLYLFGIWVTAAIVATPALYSHIHYLKIPVGNISETQLLNATDYNVTTALNNNQSINSTEGANIIEMPICYPYPEYMGPDFPKTIVLIKSITHYFLPLFTIGTFYIIMARHLLRSSRSLPGQATVSAMSSSSTPNRRRFLCSSVKESQQWDAAESQQQEPHRNQQNWLHQQKAQGRARRKVAKMVLSFVILFAICFFPMHIFFLWFYFNPNAFEDYNEYWHYFRIIGFCLSFINSCINPIALYFISSSFQKHFNRLLCRRSSDYINSQPAEASSMSHYTRRMIDTQTEANTSNHLTRIEEAVPLREYSQGNSVRHF